MASPPGRAFGSRNRVAASPRPSPALRPPRPKLVQLTARVPEELREVANQQAAAADVSLSAYIARLIASDVGLPDPLGARCKDQEELPLTKAS
jgi:hypothetical protein